MNQFKSNILLAGSPNGIATGIDWPSVDFKSEAGRNDAGLAISDYFKDVRIAANLKVTRPGHLGLLPTAPDLDLNVYGPQDQTNILNLFRSVDKRGSKNPTFQFAHVDGAGIMFEQKKAGELVKIRKVTDAAASSVSSVTYWGALGIDDDAARFDEYGIYESNVQMVPSVWDDHLATMHAALFTAQGAGINEAFATDLQTTINNGCAQILEDIGDTYGVADNPTFGLLYNHRQAPVVRKALVSDLTLANDNNSSSQLEFEIVPVKTRKIPAGSMYLCLPGYDMVNITWDDLMSESGRDYARGVDALIYKARQNSAIGNTKQLRRIPLS